MALQLPFLDQSFLGEFWEPEKEDKTEIDKLVKHYQYVVEEVIWRSFCEGGWGVLKLF